MTATGTQDTAPRDTTEAPIHIGPVFPPRPRPSFSKIGNTVVLVVLAGTAAWSVVALKINIATFIDGYDNALDFLNRTVPLRLPPLDELWDMVAQTLAIVVLATVLGFVISLPVALLAAHNTTVNRTVRAVARVYIVVQRALPEFIIAMFFVRALGLGALPGIIALGLGSVGMMAKLFTDATEELDPGPREALRATGAGKLQQIVGAVIPGLKPTMVATTLHAFDINLRGSVILGFVGVSGIGMHISAALDTLNYRTGLGLTLVLLVLCLAAELVSGMIRSSLLGHDYAPKHTSLLRRVLPRSPSPGAAAPANTPKARRGATSSTVDSGRVSAPWHGDRLRRTMWTVTGVAILVLSVAGAGISVHDVEGGLAKAFHTLSLYFPPGTGGIPEKLVESMVETVQMGLAGTLLGLVVALPFGLLAARNVSSPRIAVVFRGIVVAIRAIPGIIVGICFVVITGLGATAGALALAVGAIGFFSKIIADSLEEADIRVQDAIRTTGAGGGQIFIAATLRQVAPALASHTMHQLDTSLRGATALGVIGAGGIGYYLNNASRVLQYDVVTTCLLMIIATVLLAEGLALWTRREVK